MDKRAIATIKAAERKSKSLIRRKIVREKMLLVMAFVFHLRRNIREYFGIGGRLSVPEEISVTNWNETSNLRLNFTKS